MHLKDDISNRRFLVDTGAAFSVFPHSSEEPPSGPRLKGPAGRIIRCWGQRTLQLSFNGLHFSWDFLLAEVEFPILGVDFLRHHKLAVDAAAGHLLHTEALQRLGTASTEAAGELASILSSTPALYRTIFSEFPEVVDAGGNFPPPKHGVEHHIVTSGRPVTARFRRLDPEKLVAAKKEFERMEADGIIRRSDSCWSSPLHMVQKSDGSWRPCCMRNLVDSHNTIMIMIKSIFIAQYSCV
jgi:hypothetical protein